MDRCNFDICDLSDEHFVVDIHERCITNFVIDVIKDGDHDFLQTDSSKTTGKNLIASFNCLLCHEDDESYDLVEMCDDISDELYVAATALRYHNPLCTSMLYIESYEANSEYIEAHDIAKLIELMCGFIYQNFNINPEGVTMIPDKDGSCYPLGMGNCFPVMDNNVYLYDRD
jgi:hypothetical protein